MTREMLVSVLYRQAGSPAVSGRVPFSDVREGRYYTDAVRWAALNNVISGYPNGRFGVGDRVTRQDAAAVLWRYEDCPAAEAGQDFADKSSIAGYARTAVDWARTEGIISGRGENRFVPQGQATRAEIATIMMKYLSRDDENSGSSGGEGGGSQEPPAPGPDPKPEQPASGKTLVVYFSATGSTERVAGYIADALGADKFELIPTEPYTSADLNWNADGSRVNREHDDESLRDIALTKETVENWDEYDTVLIGYPIWWGIAAWPVNNFVKHNDFTGKIVVPFCTSSSSGLGQSGELLQEMAGTGDWQTGMRFGSGASESVVRNWALSLT